MHKYSDYCVCPDCELKWQETLLKAIDKMEQPKKKPKKSKK